MSMNCGIKNLNILNLNRPILDVDGSDVSPGTGRVCPGYRRRRRCLTTWPGRCTGALTSCFLASIWYCHTSTVSASALHRNCYRNSSLCLLTNKWHCFIHCTNNLSAVEEWRHYFSFALPREVVCKRTEKSRNLCASWMLIVTNCYLTVSNRVIHGYY